jgi:hypothetical protein
MTERAPATPQGRRAKRRHRDRAPVRRTALHPRAAPAGTSIIANIARSFDIPPSRRPRAVRQPFSGPG